MPYTTADPRSVDYMYQMPEQMMLQAVQTSDNNIDKISDQNDALSNHLNSINALSSDQPALKQAADNYRSQIDDITKQIQQDPANYRKLGPQLRTISRGLQNDEILKGVQDRYNQVSTWQKENDKLAQEGKIDPLLYNSYKSTVLPSLLQQSAYNPETKQFGNVNLPSISKSIDYNKKAEEWMKGAKPVKNEQTGDIISKNGEWLVQTERGQEYMSPQKVKQIWQDSKDSDLEVQNHIQQLNQYLPKINATNDPNHTYNPNTFNIGAGDYIANKAMNAAVDKYVYNDKKDKQELKVNPWEKTYFDANQKVNEEKLKRSHELEDNNTELNQHIATLYGKYISTKPTTDAKGNIIHNDKETDGIAAYNEAKQLGFDLNEYNKHTEQSAKTDNPITTVTPSTTSSTSSSSTKQDNIEPENVKQNSGGTIVVNPFNGEKKLTPSLVLSKINTTQQQISQLTKDLDNIPDNDEHKDERGSYKEQIRNANDALVNYNTIYNKSKDDINTKLIKDKGYTPEEIADSRKPSTIGKINNQLTDLITKYNNGDISQLSAIKQLQNTKDHYQGINDDYNKEQNNWFKNNSEHTSSNVDYIGVNSDESKGLLNSISLKPKQISIVDPSTGNDLSGQMFKDKHNLSKHNPLSELGATTRNYSFDTDDPSSLGSYLKSNGKNINDVLDIQGVSSPIPGMGVTITTKIKDVPGLDPKKNYILKIPSDIATSFATSYKPKNSQEETIKSNIINREKSNFISNSSEMFANDGKGLPKVITIPNPVAGQNGSIGNITLKLIPKQVGNETRIFVEGSTDGKTFKKPQSFPESFSSVQEIADAIYK